jgi:hypothetical protein
MFRPKALRSFMMPMMRTGADTTERQGMKVHNMEAGFNFARLANHWGILMPTKKAKGSDFCCVDSNIIKRINEIQSTAKGKPYIVHKPSRLN